MKRYIVLTIFIEVLGARLIAGQTGETCASRLAELYPRQDLDLDKLMGEWMIVEAAWRNETLVVPPFAVCFSQVLSKLDNSDNLNIRAKLNMADSGMHIERDGQVNLTISKPQVWRWSYFDNPSQYWDGMVIATDYDTYWIHYECEEQNGFRIESAVIRTRSRTITPEQKKLYESLVEGLGFPLSNFVEIPQNGCEGSKKPISSNKPHPHGHLMQSIMSIFRKHPEQA